MNKSGSPLICGDFNFHVEDKTNKYAKRFNDICEIFAVVTFVLNLVLAYQQLYLASCRLYLTVLLPRCIIIS